VVRLKKLGLDLVPVWRAWLLSTEVKFLERQSLPDELFDSLRVA